MNAVDTQYLNLLQDILANGEKKPNRTGVDTLSVFGRSLRFDLGSGFPILTTKKVHWRSVVHELLWFLRGDTYITYLQDQGVYIWDEWADENNYIGPSYGSQWRRWQGISHTEIDQLLEIIARIKKDPWSRRLLVSAWNPDDLDKVVLPPCHYSFQFYVSADKKLSCLFNMRSVDVFLGLPFNIASYALLTHMIAQVCDLGVKELVWYGGDVHLYLNHMEQVNVQLSRDSYPSPTLELDKSIKSIDDFRYKHINLVDYQHQPAIKAKVAV